MTKIKNVSFFANAGIGEFGTSHAQVNHNDKTYTVHTVLANELLKERAEIYKLNYPETEMVVGSITDHAILNTMVQQAQHCQPISATVSPPCQGSSGLNAFKYQKYDFRNQLIKSFLQFLNQYHHIEFGYIENVLNYYKESIPALCQGKVFLDYIEDHEGYVHGKYILLSDDLNFCKENNGGELKKKIHNKKAYAIFETKGNSIPSDSVWIEPINIKEFIQKSLKELGYNSQYQVVRGEEYGSPQIRQRGFLIFYKEKYPFSYPKPLFKTSKEQDYNGKTILDALVCKNLIKVNNTGSYEDLAVSYEEYLDSYKKAPNFHYKPKINPRHSLWLENTPEGTSCYFNTQRHHRPYKIIQISASGKKNNQNLMVLNDDPQDWIKKGIIDFSHFVPDWIKQEEKDFSQTGRQWRIEKIKNRKFVEQKMEEFSHCLLNKDFKGIQKNFPHLVNYAEKLLAYQTDKFYMFFPIKGFEQATYKRAFLHLPSSALTTKMGVGNSNTVHPIFNRTWSPKETMTLFGLGIKLENGQYISIEDYKLPKEEHPKKLETLIYEICGEGIIALVAEAIIEQLVSQYLQFICSKN